ncbi:MAG TPA: hypothetical protein VFZ15_07065 [Acidimicrobiia bacterium]|nr:hypothetical protein [Acidimicrobiia bacterium]
MMRVRLVLLLLLVAACATTTPTVDAPLETSASLRVFQEQQGDTMYMEGQVSYLSVNGTEQEFRPETTEVTLLVDMDVRVGEVTVESWQRPCDGNCDTLDAPANQCSMSVEVDAGQTVRLLVSFTPGPDPCVLSLIEEDPIDVGSG